MSSDLSAKVASALPVISIAPWLDGSDTKGRLSTSAALHAACLEYGFFYLDISAFADPSEPEELARLAHEFFDLPQEEKDKLSLSNQDHARGALAYSPSNFRSFLTPSRVRSPQGERDERQGR